MSHRVALDTNAYTALNKREPIVVSAVQRAVVLGLPVIVLGELYFGFEKGTKKRINLIDLEEFLQTERLEILHITPRTARIFGEISAELAFAGKPIQQNNIWIAALCKQYDYTLISADKGFKHIIGLDVISF